MKKIICALMTLVVFFTVAATFSACSDGEFTVEFYVSGELVNTERTVDGRFSYTYPKPSDGVFKGWFSDEECTKPFSGKKVNKNTKLYGYVQYVLGS